jgi:hypothetical protein
MKPSILLLMAAVLLAACSSQAVTSPQGGALGLRTPTSSSTPAASVTATATPKIDACLFGKWLIEANSLGAYLLANITSDPAATITAGEVSGELFLSFDEDFKMALDSKSYVLILEIDSPESSFNPTVLRLAMSASGTASFAVHTGALITYDQDYELEEGNKIGIDLSSTSLTISPLSLTPDNFFTTPWQPEAESDYLPPVESPRSTQYQCAGNLLTIGLDAPVPVAFTRAEEE